jgi:cytochrome c peroxidase
VIPPGSRLAASLVLFGAGLWACACARPAPPGPAAVVYKWQLPPGLPVPRVPPDNSMTEAKVQLGRRLFHDTRLSGNGTFSCASCHSQAHAFTDGRARATGSTGQAHARSTMTLANVAYNASLGWADEVVRTLEAQMAVPMFNEHPIELGMKGREAEIVARFAADTDLALRFRDAFPHEADPVSMTTIVKAIAAFERTLLSGNSALDRYLYRDDRAALTPQAVRGMQLFFSDRLSCAECHGGFNLSGPTDHDGATGVELKFHNTGLYDVDGRGSYPAIDRGLIDVTFRSTDMGRFRAPTLRNIAVTGPYMHDGSVPTLEAVVAHYASGGQPSRFRHPKLKGFRISARETTDLLAFLNSLTDHEFLGNPAFGPPIH